MELMTYFLDYLAKYTPYKSYWNYEDGCVLKGCIDLYRATGREELKQFVLRYVSERVCEDGSIPTFDTKKASIDAFNCGKALFFALEETGEERYRKAIDFHMARLAAHPRCNCGSFWHKEQYPDQIWLDGLYMAQPLYMAYEMQFDKMEKLADVTQQFRNVRKYLWNAEKGLHYHACDESRTQFWADPETGCSANFWLRSNGWYLMALVDCIESCQEMLYEHYRLLIDLFRESLRGLLAYRAEDGLFWQVIDLGALPGNYTETSGSAMIAYSILKAVRLGIIDPERYLPIGKDVFEALVRGKLRVEDGILRLMDICLMAGLGPATNPARDGSAAYYLSEPRCADDSKGVGPFMMAFAEYLRAQ